MATQPTNDIVEIASLDTTLPSTGLVNKLEPPTSIQTVGYDANELVPAEDLNYTLNNFSVWLQYFKDINDETTFIGGDGIDVSNSTLGEEVSISVDNTVARTPETLNNTTTNTITSSSHTHEVDFASAFSPTSVSGSTESITLPNGIIIKTAIFTESADNTDQKTWTDPFPNGVLNIQVTPIYDGNSGAFGNVYSYDNNGVIFTAGDFFGNGTTAFVMAIGY